MGLGFTSYVVDNDKRFEQAIQRSLVAVDDLSIPFRKIAQDFYRSEKAIFQLQGPGQYPDIGGFNRNEVLPNGRRRWQEAMRRKHARVGFVYPLLKASGLLEKSVTSSGSRYSILDINKTNMAIGTRVPYGVYHQSDGPRKKLPQRKFLFIGPEAPQFATSDQMGRAERWLNYINDFVLAKLGVSLEGRGQEPK
jgi:phage gpG-like protein